MNRPLSPMFWDVKRAKGVCGWALAMLAVSAGAWGAWHVAAAAEWTGDMAWRNDSAAWPRAASSGGTHLIAEPSPTSVAPTTPTFTNPLYPGADPWVIRYDDSYYLCQSAKGGRIEVWRSSTLTDKGAGATVWAPPGSGWNRDQVWAPELHRVAGRWYIYYAASDGRNANHRMGVLESLTDDPQGPFADRGMLYTGDDPVNRTHNRWAIDGTLLQHRGRLYFIWSGWESDRDVQHLYIAPMSDPLTISGPRIRLCVNDTHPWERVGDDPEQRGLHEGPAALIRNGKVFLVYSCSGSWQPTYKMGLLHAEEAADLLSPSSWRKSDRPVFEPAGDVFGVGHCSFTTSPDGREDWVLYHSKVRRSHGWDRVVRAQRFSWTSDGFPHFSRPAASDVPLAPPSTPYQSRDLLAGADATSPAHLRIGGSLPPPGAAASPSVPD